MGGREASGVVVHGTQCNTSVKSSILNGNLLLKAHE